MLKANGKEQIPVVAETGAFIFHNEDACMHFFIVQNNKTKN